MNQHLYRLVFCRRLGMRVAVAEHASSDGKVAGGVRRRTRSILPWAAAAALALTAAGAGAQSRPPVIFASKLPAPANPLPVPYGKTFLSNGNPVNTAPRPFAYNPANGVNSTDLATVGAVGWSVQGKTATFDQGNIDRVILNWDSFDIGSGYSVHFKQNQDPAKYVSALNRIWSADPSLILGSLTADREVILLNANGVYFGRGARVDTGKFVATSLAIADSVFDKGLRNVTDASSVFTGAGTDYLPTSRNSAVTVEAGAELRSAAGGDVLLFAPRVTNQGRIETPGGQTVLAAGDKVYLMSSSDPKQRGLIVAVDPLKVAGSNDNDSGLGIVENSATGSYRTLNGATVDDSAPDSTTGLVRRINEIRAESGTVNLVGLTVRQSGTVNATTAVKGANGAIYLQSMASTTALVGGNQTTTAASRRGLTTEAGSQVRVGADLGSVALGAGSVTAVLPDASSATQIDAETFNKSILRVEGAAIHVAERARIEAPSGTVELLAAQNSVNSPLFDRGLTTLPAPDNASRIVIAPDARVSVAGLRGVAVDGARNQGAQRLFRIELADAPVQRAGPLYRSEVFFDLRDGGDVTAANVAGAAAAIQRTASELSTSGGTLRIEAEGAVVVGANAQLDASGGSIHYSQATLRDTLVAQDGNVVLFKSANGGIAIDSVLGSTQARRSPAYSEGANGGSISISGRQLALTGVVKGDVTEGDRQRDGSSVRATPSGLTIGRLVGGAFFYLAELELVPGGAVTVDPGLFMSPLTGSLSTLPGVATLSVSDLNHSAIGSLTLSAGRISQSEVADLKLGIQGKLEMRADTINLTGRYSAPGGSISLATVRGDPNPGQSDIGNIHIANGSHFDVSGSWTNDTAATAGSPGAGIQTRGGTVSMTAARSLLIGRGSTIDVSGGARLAGNGSVSRGNAGAITMATGRTELFDSELAIAGVALRGFDFAAGGSLTIGAPELTVSDAATNGFLLSPDFFSSGGFGNIAVNAFGDVRVASATRLEPTLLNWQFAAGYRSAPSGHMTEQVAVPQPVDERLAERKPVSLSLAATRPLNPARGLAGSNLTVERGAAISLQAGGKLALTATRNMELGVSGSAVLAATELSAPGGQVNLAIVGTRGVASALDTSADSAGFLDDQVLWIGAGTNISAAGTAKLRPDTGPVYLFMGNPGSRGTAPGDRVTGTVYGGGSIHLQAQRGYVVADAGSTLSVDGAAAEIGVPGLPNPVRVAKAAGSITVASPEGFVLDGAITAQGPRDSTGRALADGGQIDLAVGLGGVYTVTAGTLYPGALVDLSGNPVPGAQPKPRQLVIADFDGLLAQRGASYGGNLAAALDNGIGYVPTALLRDAGFSALRLGAGDLIQFDSSLRLESARRIDLDAPALKGRPGVDVSLKSGYISLGDSTFSRIGRPADTSAVAASAGQQTRLHLEAPTIDVFGNSGFQGFSNVELDAGATHGGEVRLMSLITTNLLATDAPRWSLNFAGDLDITAAQVFAGTGSNFTLLGLPAADDNDPGSRLSFRRGATGGARTIPLSVFGSLTAQATTIAQAGVLRQPFGAITLNAQRTLTLGADSITSVAADGSTLLYGETVNLSQWLAGTDFATRLPVDKAITLSASNLVTADTAMLNAAGGGDITAWEFFPGVGGSTDYFETEGLYAVLPDYAQVLATGFAGGPLNAAQRAQKIVITMDGSNLKRGSYTLLPARYALLGGTLPNGAFLVQRAPDQGKTVLNKPIVQDDGSEIVTAYIGSVGSVNVGNPGERFVIQPQATLEARSEIRISSVSDLLRAGAARQGTVSAPPLPRDGGRVLAAVTGTERSTWNAGLDLRANGGRAGLFDVSAPRLALVDDLAKTPAASLGISAQVITDSGAGSVLLGASRTLAAASNSDLPTWVIDTSGTQALTVDIGQRALVFEELVLAASDNITLADGTHLSATRLGTLGASRLTANADGVLALVGANSVGFTRTAAALATGDLVVGAGSVFEGATVNLDATGSLRIDPTTRLVTQALELGARAIVVGSDTAAAPRATVLSGELLAAAQGASSLTLRSYSSIDFVGEQDWAQREGTTATRVQERLVLDAPMVRGIAVAGGAPPRTDIAARSIELRNSSGLAAPAPAGEGSLTLQAIPPLKFGTTGGLTMGPGEVALGFDSVALRSTGDIVLHGAGATIAQQDLQLSAARLTGTSTARQSISASDGALAIMTESASKTLGERVGQGASVSVRAKTVRQDGRIELPGGLLGVVASGNGNGSGDPAISIGVGSLTSVAGFGLTSSDGFEVFGRAGAIDLKADLGGIDLLGVLDVSAARRVDGSPGGGSAGRISVQAAGAGGNLVLARTLQGGTVHSGELIGQSGAGSGDSGGRLLVDLQYVDGADAIARQAATGGFDTEFALRARLGKLELATDIRSNKITLSADAGKLAVGAARLDAAGPSGGVVQLSAGDDITIGTGSSVTRIDARSKREGANGGDVLVSSTSGRITIAPGASIDVRGDDGADGRIVLRAQRGADNASIKVDALDTSQLIGAQVDIEAVRRYSGITTVAAGNSNGTTLGQATVRNDSAAFMNAKTAVLDTLGVQAADAGRVNLRAGVEVVSSGNLTINGDWQLANDRAGGDAGFLTLRAAGNLAVNGSISDGFSTATSTGVINDNDRSWSYRLVAGADLNGANPLAVQDLGDSPTASGNLTIASGRLLRTGAGSIELAAGRDVLFAAGSGNTPQGLVYVAGRRAADQSDVLSSLFGRQSAKPTFTEQGGRLSVQAQRDIVSAEATQLINNWFWRSGLASTSAGEADLYSVNSQLAWWSEFSRFRQTMASFGGGDLTVSAGRDVVNVQAMVPTSAWAGSRVMATAEMQIRNGGDLSVMADRDVLGGQFFVGRGEGKLAAGGSIAIAASNARLQAPALALLDGGWKLKARDSITTTGAFNPTAMNVPNADNRSPVSGFFYTWGPDAELSLNATVGTINLLGLPSTQVRNYGLTTGAASPDVFARVMPATLKATAATADVQIFTQFSGGGLLFPSAISQLELWAGRNISLGGTGVVNLAMADASPTLWPSANNPMSGSQAASQLAGADGLINNALTGAIAGAALHAMDDAPVQIHALGQLEVGDLSTLTLAKQARITAGEDIRSLRLVGQNLAQSDLTSITAGRHLLAGLTGKVAIGGPGALEVIAGTEIDLGSSEGISTSGNQTNANLPAGGASIKIKAGVAGTLDLAAFDLAYLQPNAGGSARWQQYRNDLVSLVGQALGQPITDFDAAWNQFKTFPTREQAAFGNKVLAAEFGATYLVSPAPSVPQLAQSLQMAFARNKANVLLAGNKALASNSSLTLPGREVLQGAELASYLAELRSLSFADLDLDSIVPALAATRSDIVSGWQNTIAASLGGTVSSFESAAAANPLDPSVLAYRAALQDFSGRGFESYRDRALVAEIASAGAAAAQFGRKSLPMRLTLYDEAFRVAELSGLGSFESRPIWAGPAPILNYAGTLAMTQSSVITERGGNIFLANAGGSIEVGLKENSAGSASSAKGVIALGGGDIFGFAKSDFQVNTQRVFIVGAGDMNVWSSSGDIDSGRGANTAVAAPPLTARRSVDGVVFEVAATTTGSGLGILADAAGNRAGTIGLYPAFGEILALDAFIRAPLVVLGSSIQGADNLQSASVGGAAAPVSVPPLAVAAPTSNESRSAETQSRQQSQQERTRSALLTVELLGLGPATPEEECSEQDQRDGKCTKAKTN